MKTALMATALWVAGLGVGLAADELALVRDGASEYVICLPNACAPVEQTAARELQEHLLAVTGAKLEIRPESAVPGAAKQIVVGNADRLKTLVPDLDTSRLADDGMAIRTVGDTLVLTGRAPRGPLYAVFTFLEDVVGCRWWTSSESFLPKKPTLTIPPQHLTYAPPLLYREAFYRDAFQPVFAARLKLNGHHGRVPEEYGGHLRFSGFVHTFYPLLPPEKYFAAHPDWYSEIDGRRTTERAQICLTNEEMRAELVRNALAWLRQDAGAKFISISQNDWYGRCQCRRCLEVEKTEESPAGPLLHFVNRVAEDLEKEFPDVLVETLAYQYTRQPPRHVKPRNNVVVRLCSIECSFVQPLGTGPQNEKFRSDIEGWSKIAPRLFVWDYVTNFSNYILPHANLRVLAPNIRFFVDHRVIGLFEQGDAGSSVGDFVRLRAWLIAHLLWNPQADEKALIDEFLQGYYGAAAPHLKAYLDLIHDAAERSGVYLRCFMSDTSEWLTMEDLNRATRLFDQAAQAVAGDAVLAERVRRERMPLDHAWLQRYDTLKLRARLTGAEFLGPADPQKLVDEYLKLGQQYHAGSSRENGSFAEHEQALRCRFRPAGAPPEECRNLPTDAWIDVQDNQFRLAGTGEWAAMVDDPAASDGKAVRMPGDHYEWAIQYPISDDLKSIGNWRCFVVARAKAQATAGSAMTTGIYDAEDKRGVAHRQVTVEEAASETYRVFDLGIHPLRGGMYVWVAPPKRPGEVEAVFVDRIFFVRSQESSGP